MRARICVLTGTHLSTCPRMLKAADALAGAGYEVRVVSARHTAWATAADAEVRRARLGAWRWYAIDYRRGTRRHAITGARLRAARALARSIGPAHCAVPLAARAFSRAHSELAAAAAAEPADLYYGGTAAGLAATAEAARRRAAPYALDLEDFHSQEQEDDASGRLDNALAAQLESHLLPRARFLTAASQAIADEYRCRYRLAPVAIHNTFPLPASAPDVAPSAGDGLTLYWFSQTIGPGRGLEDVVRAMGLGAVAGALHLRGSADRAYLGGLRRLARETAERLEIVVHEPVAPDEMIGRSRGYDLGLALEQGQVLNRALCLTNKALTYMLAGLALVMTDTPGQRPLAADVGDVLLYAPGDVPNLAKGLVRWAHDRTALARAKAAAWRAACRRWHWEHPAERGALLDTVAEALGRR
jgi:hypothetical protein